jgi:dTDP-glucose 4,6-dehydratase
MNLLVTGGAGFIGSNLVRFLMGATEVKRLVNLDCLTYAGHLENLAGVAEHSGYVFEKVDLRDQAAVLEVMRKHQITHVMHLAAESHVDRSIRGPADFIHTNIVGTFHLLDACRAVWGTEMQGKRFLHVSTDEVYGSLPAEGVFTETNSYAPRSPYAASKAASDMMVRAYHHTYGLPVLVTNSSNNYGPFQYPEKLIPVAIQSLLQRRPIPIYGDGQNVRDWLHVADHVQALWRVLNEGRVGETYNIGARQEMTNLSMVEVLCDLVDGLRPDLGGSSRRLIACVPDRPGHDRRYAIDPSKIQAELGWRAEYTFEKGIRDTVAWYLDHQDWVMAVTEKKQPQ